MQLRTATSMIKEKGKVSVRTLASKKPIFNFLLAKLISAVVRAVIFVNLHPLVAARASFKPYPGWLLGTGQYPEDYESSPMKRVRRQFWQRMKKPCLIRWLDGLCVYVFPGTEISRAVFLTGLYEPTQFSLLNRILRSGMTFIDIGANVGLYTLFAAKKVGREGTVVAIEPSSREFDRLKVNAEANGLNNVRFLRAAMGNRKSATELLVAAEEHSGHNTLGKFGYDSVIPQCKEQVPMERLDDVVRQEGLVRVDVIKLDIEGAEFFALQGAVETLAHFRPVLFLELSDRTLENQGCSSKQVWEVLTQAGYRIYGYDNETASPEPVQQDRYCDSENIVAVHEHSKETWLG